MANDFQPYQDWLGLTGVGERPNYYELLGLDEFTSDEQLIRGAFAAVQRRLATVRPAEQGVDGRLSIWEEVNREAESAVATLSDPAARASYDQWLRGGAAPAAATPSPAGVHSHTPVDSRANLYPPGMGPVGNSAPHEEQPRGTAVANPSQPNHPAVPMGGVNAWPPGAGAAVGQESQPYSPAMSYPPANPMAPAGAVDPRMAQPAPYAQQGGYSQPGYGAPGYSAQGYPAQAQPVAGYPGQMPYGAPAAVPGAYGQAPAGYQQPMGYPQPMQNMGPMAPMGGYQAAPMAAAAYPMHGQPYQPQAAMPMASVPMANPMAPAGVPMAYAPAAPMAGYAAPAATPAAPAEVSPKVRTAGAAAARSRRERDAQGGLIIWGTIGGLVLIGMAAVGYKFLGGSATEEVIIAQAPHVPDVAPPKAVTPAPVNPAGTGTTKENPAANSSNGGKPTEGLSTGGGMAGTRPGKKGKDKGKENAAPGTIVSTSPEKEGMTKGGESETPEEMEMEKPAEAMPEKEGAKPTPETPGSSTEPEKSPAPAPMPVKLPERTTVEELERHLQKAKQSLAEHNQDVFNRAIEQAEAKAVLPEHRAKLNRLKLLATYAGEFRKAIVKSFEAMDGGESFKVGNSTQVSFVDFTGKKAVVRVAGGNREYPLADLPPGLGVAVAHFSLSAQDANSLLMEGAYLVAHRKAGTEELARAAEVWSLAEAGGAPVAELLPILKDSYELLKDFDALVAKQGATNSN